MTIPTPLWIAGHQFINGICVSETGEGENKRRCGRYLVDILGTEKVDIGKRDIAHSSTLNDTEWGQIESYVKKLRENIDAATGAAKNG